MKHFFTFCLLSFILLSGRTQSYLLHPSQLDTLSLIDSIWAGTDRLGFRQNGGAVGLLNGRYPATVVDDTGIVLVAKSAIQPYLPLEDTVRLSLLSVPFPLKSVVISFPLSSEELTAQILPTEQVPLSYEEQMAHIQRQIVQLEAPADSEADIRTNIKPYQQQNRFFRHRYRDFTKVELLAYTNQGNGADYALLRIFGASPYPKAPRVNLRDSINQAAYTTNYPPRTYYQNSVSALQLHLEALKANLYLLESAMAVYQTYSRLPPQALANFYVQQVNAHHYLQVSEALSHRQTKENQLLVHPPLLSLASQLRQQAEALADLHRFYHLSQSLNQSIQLMILTRFLDQQADRRSDTEQRILSFLDNWLGDWNASIDQKLFTQLTTLYFDESQASYFSTKLLDQIRSSEKSFELLGQQIYSESLLAQPQRLRYLLLEMGSDTLFQALERDIGYLFFRQLLYDQQENIFRPYRKSLQEWTALERSWLKRRAKVAPFLYLEGNATQRYHLLVPTGISALPTWENTAGSPLFNHQHALVGFAFPQNGTQPGIEWSLPKPGASSYLYYSIREIRQTIELLKP